MEPKPVRESKTPSYPTRRDVLAGGAAFVLASLCGRWYVFAAEGDGNTIVAPIFEHGKGREDNHAALGCVAVTPPVFLSEEEAMQVVREELGKHGIELKAGRALQNVRIPLRMAVANNGAAAGPALPQPNKTVDGAVPLKLDGVDSEKKIAVEFISRERYAALHKGPNAAGDNYKETAKFVAAEVKRQGKEPIYVGVFYDPVVPTHSFMADGKRERAEAKGLLRKQVKDFTAWLKKQKVIE
jgi:hypothetical protein